jgi:hypothetical protein
MRNENRLQLPGQLSATICIVGLLPERSALPPRARSDRPEKTFGFLPPKTSVGVQFGHVICFNEGGLCVKTFRLFT